MAKNGLDKWFAQKWVDIGSKKKDGSFSKCGRSKQKANTKVKIQGDTHGTTNLSIDKHYEYSVLIEDITEVQALSSLRKFYTDDAGYALAKQVDTDLLNLTEGLQGGTVGGAAAASWEKAYIGSTGATLYTGNSSNAADITDAGIRALLLKLDDADVPMDNRSLIIPSAS